jgi:GT2 family glycosyltransferase
MWPFSRPSDVWRHHAFETIRIDGGASAIRRDAFLKTGKFAEHFSPYGAEDAHFSYKLIQQGYHIRYEPAVKVVHAFSTAGRTSLQFSYHVRNSLWIPMEFFPWPFAFFSGFRKAVEFFLDACHNHLFKAYLRGIWLTLSDYRWSRRTPISGKKWQALRNLIKEDKTLAETDKA